jgi:hypothetical protein
MHISNWPPSCPWSGTKLSVDFYSQMKSPISDMSARHALFIAASLPGSRSGSPDNRGDQNVRRVRFSKGECHLGKRRGPPRTMEAMPSQFNGCVDHLGLAEIPRCPTHRDHSLPG